ncbi:MAG: LPS export ABC transporter periplasmic protein LptC [Sulfuritalea sp.]|nr:LPS export ABC transporter periplasmic protein LptC [Sulfuritalea sp.]
MLFPLLLAGLLAGLSYWLELASRAPMPAEDDRLRTGPDFIVDQFEVRRYDMQGLLQHTVVAARMRHYPQDDTTIISAPRITYHRDPPTLISAREARLSDKGEHVRLIDEVRISRRGIDGRPDTVLTTSLLDVWPEEETARTNMPVTIAQGRSQIAGSSLNADNTTSTYVLEGAVRGVFFREEKALVGPQPVTKTRTSR